MSCTYFKTFIVVGSSSAFSVRFSRETVPRVKSWHGIDGLGLESWLLVGGRAVWWQCGECAAYTNRGEQLLPESVEFQPSVLSEEGRYVRWFQRWALRAWCVGSVREQAVYLGRRKSNHDGGTRDQSMPLGCHWAIRNFHWHDSSDEWSYMTQGVMQIYLTSPDGQPWGSAVNTIGAGGVWFFPRGWPHAFVCVSEEGCNYVLTFNGPQAVAVNDHMIAETYTQMPDEIASYSMGMSQGEWAEAKPKAAAFTARFFAKVNPEKFQVAGRNDFFACSCEPKWCGSWGYESKSGRQHLGLQHPPSSVSLCHPDVPTTHCLPTGRLP